MVSVKNNSPSLKRLILFLDTLETRRQDHISAVISGLHNLKSRLYKDEGNCSFECSSMLLGALVKGMNAACILDSIPKSKLEGYSFMALEKAVLHIQEPNYSFIPNSYSLCRRSEDSVGLYLAVPQRCTLFEKTWPIINVNRRTMFGLDLIDFTCYG